MTFRTAKQVTTNPQGIMTITYQDGTKLTIYPESMESTLNRSTLDDHLLPLYPTTDEH